MTDGERTHAEILAMYNQGVEDIRTFQERQASVTTSTLAMFGALVAYAKATRAEDNLLTMIALATTIAGGLSCGWLVSLQFAMNHAREVVRGTRDTFTEAARNAVPTRSRPSFRVAYFVLIPTVAAGWLFSLIALGRLPLFLWK
jgi:hypothetical protein